MGTILGLKCIEMTHFYLQLFGDVTEVWASYLHALILAHDAGQLQVTFDLLSDLLEAVDDGHRGDGMDTTQDVQSHVHQTLGGGGGG